MPLAGTESKKYIQGEPWTLALPLANQVLPGQITSPSAFHHLWAEAGTDSSGRSLSPDTGPLTSLRTKVGIGDQVLRGQGKDSRLVPGWPERHAASRALGTPSLGKPHPLPDRHSQLQGYGGKQHLGHAREAQVGPAGAIHAREPPPPFSERICFQAILPTVPDLGSPGAPPIL